MTTMPRIDLAAANLNDAEMLLASQIISSKGKNKGSLRASKPSGNGDAAYIWRMVAFQISPLPQHHCMPVCADLDIDVPSHLKDRERYDWRRAHAAELMTIVDRIVNTLDASEWHGIKRWRRAFYG